MDYLKIYQSLTERGKTAVHACYTERHHIIPKCMGGSDEDANLTTLTAKEHFLAHLLLIKIYPDNHKLYYALLMMIRDPHNNRRYTSKSYETAKRYYSRMLSKRQTENNIMWSETARKKHSERMRGDNNPIRRFPDKNPFKGTSYVKGRKWFNNGVQNLYLSPDQIIPDGFVPGMKYQKRK